MQRGSALTAVAVLAVAALGPAVPANGASSSVQLAPGVVYTRSSFGMRAGSTTVPERVMTLSIALSAHTSLVAASPGDVIGAPRATVLTMARQERAVAGINGDFFYLTDPTAVPRGGLSHNGHVLKSALVAKQAALYVTPGGVAVIGDPRFAGSVQTDDGRHSYRIRSVNSLENARNGALTLADRALVGGRLPGCTVARLAGTSTAGTYRVTSVTRRVTSFTRPAVGTRALAICGSGEQWLTANLRVGHDVRVSAGYGVGRVPTLLSGGRVLIRSGARYNDKAGLLGYGNQRKPETFGCVLRDGRHVLLGVVEGGHSGAAGMTYAELTTYLLGRKCWSALTYDGSGSSTLVAKLPGHALAVQNRTTDRTGPRKVVDGLFVVRH